MRHKFTILLLASILTAAALAALHAPGCAGGAVSREDTNSIIDAGRDASSIIEAQLAEARADAAALPQDSDARAKLEAYIDATESVRRKIEEGVAILVEHQSEDGGIEPEGAVGILGAILPPPWGTIVASIGGIGLLTWRSRAIRDAAKNIVGSIEQAMKKSSNLAEAMQDPEVIAELKRAQSPLAKKIVDEAQAKKSSPLL